MTEIWADHALLPDGWARGVGVRIADGRIAGVTPGTAPSGHRAQVLLPAPANLHSHAFQRAMAGLSERPGPDGKDSFWTWRDLMFRFLDRITPDDHQAIAAFVQMEMAEAGFGASVEFHYLHHGPGGVPYDDPAEMSARVAAAAETSGLGLTLLPVLYQAGGCDGRPLGPGQVRFGNGIDGFADLVDGARRALSALPGDAGLGVAPHSLRAVTADGLATCVALAGETRPIHIHLAEQPAEVAEVTAAHGAGPVDVLMGLAPVGPRWCLVHCTQASARDLAGIAKSGAVVGLCPITEASLGDGIFAAAHHLAADGRFGIGSDSNILISLAEELRTLEYGQRLRDGARAVLGDALRSTGRRLFDEAALGGARAAGRDSGRIEAGALADLAALSDGKTGDFEGLSGDALIDTFVFGGRGAVRDLWSAGRHIVRDGAHVRRPGIARAYRAVAARLRAMA